MNKELKNIISKDIYRYYGNKKKRYPIELRYIIRWRKTKFYKVNKNKIKFLISYIILNKFSRKYHFQIPIDTEIKEGFYIGHFGRIIVNANAKIGKNCNIATGVTIGKENRGKREGTPIIGDNVWIGTNSTIVGNIKVGNNVMIAPNTFVNFDIPDNNMVLPSNSLIKESKDATYKYIQNPI